MLRFLLLIALVACGKREPEEVINPTDPVTEKPIKFVPIPPELEAELKRQAAAPLLKHDQLKRSSGAITFHQRNNYGEKIKLAIFDNGFYGVKNLIGNRILPKTIFVDGPVNPEEPTTHGTHMAEIVSALSKVELILYNTSGFSNLTAAIDDAIRRKVQVILYSQVSEFGDNFDGASGFYLAAIEKALNAGILWVNAVGNYRLSTNLGPLTIKNGEIVWPYQGKYIRLRVSAPESAVKLTLTWNDFRTDPNYKTTQDLDFDLLSSDGKTVLAQSNKIQDGNTGNNHSAHARETIETTLVKGDYLIQAHAKSKNFTSSSQNRLSAMGDQVELLDRTESSSALIPSTHAWVIATGASDTNMSGLQKSPREKPEILVKSQVEFAGYPPIQSSSTAAAIAAAVLAMQLQEAQKTCNYPCQINRKDLVDAVKRLQQL